MVSIPRLVIAAANSSAGKTTITTGLMAALRATGREVAGFKVGPDFIDPGYHGLATGRPGRNLDPVLTSEELVPRLFLHGALTPRPAEIALVEGVMGLFDGQLGRGGFGSTAHVAKLLDAPVLLVVDGAASSRTAAAAALGLAAFDPELRVGGVILNRVGSTRHADELRAVFAAAGWPVLGAVPRSAAISAPSRHLGLVPAAERDESAATIAAFAAHLAAHVELDAVLALAASAPELAVAPWRPADVVSPVSGHPRIAVLAGRAFTFRYAETTELLAAAGCEVVEVDPLSDPQLPDGVAGLYIGGGFPEMHAVELSGNASLRASIAEAIAAGLPTVAECAGQLYLAEQLDGHPMVGALAASARMTPRLTLGYRDAIAPADTLLTRVDERVIGHEFHRTQTSPANADTAAWRWADRAEGFSLDPSGSGRPSLHASYLHLHWAGNPALAQRFAEASAAFATRPADPAKTPRPRRRGDSPFFCGTVDGIDLHHHGDHDLAPGLIDLAVNVMLPGPPDWLAGVLADPAGTRARLGPGQGQVIARAFAPARDPWPVLAALAGDRA